MKILGLYLSIPTTVSLYIDGKIVAATHEERFSREKNDDRYPENAIKSCLDIAGISIDEIDFIAIASYKAAALATMIQKNKWTVDDYLTEQYKIWKPFFIDKTSKKMPYLEVFEKKIDLDRYPNRVLEKYLLDENANESFDRDRPKILSSILGVDIKKCVLVEHHRSHAAYSYYASSFREEKVLSLTIDGWGDGKNATIGEFDETGKYTEHYATDQCGIGRIYRYMTLLLGMKPNEHEFKVMGLAPYGKEKYAQKALDVFRSTLYVDGIEFKWNIKPEDSYF